jgi:hypothetical protein
MQIGQMAERQSQQIPPLIFLGQAGQGIFSQANMKYTSTMVNTLDRIHNNPSYYRIFVSGFGWDGSP